MANLFLTSKCNLKCPYCFADEFVNKDNSEITVEKFKKALDFIKTGMEERIGLIGGEPTLHPHFKDFINILNDDKQVKNVLIFTNGLTLENYIECIKPEKFRVLINCNSPQNIGKERFEKLINNIKLLKNEPKDKYTLGINLYSNEMDYSYIFKLLRILDSHELRFSTAIPNVEKENTEDILQSFKVIKPYIFEFFKNCIKNHIIPYNDCNSFPDCFYTSEDKKVLIELEMLSKKYKTSTNTISSCHTCQPVIDILPDLYAVRCFSMSRYLKVPISDFNTIVKLYKYFYNKIDNIARVTYINKNCYECKMYLLDKCGICYTYKINKMQKIKNLIMKNV